jgi:alkylhydroperoxidase family enzyme
MFGVVPAPFSVFGSRMPFSFLSFYSKVNRLDGKLTLPKELQVLVRERVASINLCTWCMDAQRWFVQRKSTATLPKLDALEDYRTSELFSPAERAALDYATALTRNRSVPVEVFDALGRNFTERQTCELAWLVSSEHLYNISNIGLGIESDGLCELKPVSAKLA